VNAGMDVPGAFKGEQDDFSALAARMSLNPASRDFKELVMRRYNMLLTGLLMIGAGVYLFFARPQILSLGFDELAGPFLWCVGIAVACAAVPLLVLRTPVPPTGFFTDNVAKPPAMPSRQMPMEVLLLQIENHVRLEQAAAESFLKFPTHDQLHSKTPSPFVN